MFDRVVMDVIQMFVKVVFVADAMIIETQLPNGFRAAFTGLGGNVS